MDLSIFETRDGGDVALKGNDLELVNSVFNQPYLAMFGSTRKHRDAGEIEGTLERFDFWGNMLAFEDNETQEFSSEFEGSLQDFALTSSGRQKLEAIVRADLAYLREIGTVTATITITGHDRIRIDVLLQEPDVVEVRNFVFLWDGTRLDEIRDLNDPQNDPAQLATLLGDEGQFLTGDEGQILFGD